MTISPCATCPNYNACHLARLGVEVCGSHYVVALGGNPNTGKSTVFNSLTGLRQHIGNWPGKTVARAEGDFGFQDTRFKLIDLPGTYSLLATSTDEEIARDFLLFGRPDVTVMVVDATRLERNLNLVFQVLEICDRVVVCLNMIDEARRCGLRIDDAGLAGELGVPVVATSARSGEGIPRLIETIHEVASGSAVCRPRRIAWQSPMLQRAIGALAEKVNEVFPGLPNGRWVALRLLDGDDRVADAIRSGELGELEVGVAAAGEPTATPVPYAAPVRIPPKAQMSAMGRELKPEAQAKELGNPPSLALQASMSGENYGLEAAIESLLTRASQLRWEVGEGFHKLLTEAIYAEAAQVADKTVTRSDPKRQFHRDEMIDRIVTSRWLGFPIMFLLLTLVFWLTVVGANYPSQMLSWLLVDVLHTGLKHAAATIALPAWMQGILIDGVYLCTAWVVSVMLPPMAIFFPVFTLLEDLGYLPRVTFNLDRLFRRVGAHGKQSLTMSMGFGCNAAGVVACRIIDSPRERLIAILTNNFSLCNGRWPTQILIASIFIGAVAPAYLTGLVTALAVVGVAIFGVLCTFLASWILSRTLLRGEVSTFSLELPPYRLPRLVQTLYRSLIERTVIVLWRAIVFAAPAGAVIWLLANVQVAGASLAEHLITWLHPAGLVVGLNGVILLAYVVAIPANEIVIPTVLMLTVLAGRMVGVGDGPGVMFELDSASATGDLLRASGWTLLTAINLMLFSLLHNPCSTTIYTIWKETGSAWWTTVSVAMPVGMGLVVCFVVAQVWRAIAGL